MELIQYILVVITFLHGIVHFLYAAHAAGKITLAPSMQWPFQRSILRKILSEKSFRLIIATSLIITGAGFLFGAWTFLFPVEWLQSILSVSVVLSSLIFFITWDFSLKALDQQGIFGILINGVLYLFLRMVG